MCLLVEAKQDAGTSCDLTDGRDFLVCSCVFMIHVSFYVQVYICPHAHMEVRRGHWVSSKTHESFHLHPIHIVLCYRNAQSHAQLLGVVETQTQVLKLAQWSLTHVAISPSLRFLTLINTSLSNGQVCMTITRSLKDST